MITDTEKHTIETIDTPLYDDVMDLLAYDPTTACAGASVEEIMASIPVKRGRGARKTTRRATPNRDAMAAPRRPRQPDANV